MSHVSSSTGRRYRAASEPLPEADRARCGRCGRAARHPGERAELTTDWIVTGPEGLEIERFCRTCAPAGRVVDLACTRCGNGPLLAGDVAEQPERAHPLLAAAGWQLTGPTCPSCTPPRTARTTPVDLR